VLEISGARRVENGVETHRGSYTYDGAGRLVQVDDAATNRTETYVWNADGTLASFAGPGYTRLLEYDEEGRLLRIRWDEGGGNVRLAYEYGYGFDGGRRWRKDYLRGVWTRYPCGVACGAGELVEQQKPLEGGSWTTSALYLQGISLVRRNDEWHHLDPLGTAQVITNGSASVVSNNLYDVFGVMRYQQGNAETPWRWRISSAENESLLISPQQACWTVASSVVSLSRYQPCSPNPGGGVWPRPKLPKEPPKPTPKWPQLPPWLQRWGIYCFSCFGSFLPGFFMLFSDCGPPDHGVGNGTNALLYTGTLSGRLARNRFYAGEWSSSVTTSVCRGNFRNFYHGLSESG
jgi:YD repeat-containing protein